MAIDIPYRDHLLPPNATDVERALSQITVRVDGIPVPIEITKRPAETPGNFVPFLAWEHSVDVWSESWDELKKRAVTAKSLPLHMKKGTVYALREYIALAGGEVKRVITPPQKFFLGEELDPAARERWLRGLPQVRVWVHRGADVTEALPMFAGGVNRFPRVAFLRDSTAITRFERRAKWVVNGVEADVKVTQLGSFYRLHLPAKRQARFLPGGRYARLFLRGSDAFRRLVTIAPRGSSPWRGAVGPSLTAVQAEPERIAEGGFTRLTLTLGRTLGRAIHLKDSTAHLRIYDRYAVHDGSKYIKRPGSSFIGTGRMLGFPAHTVSLTVAIPGMRPSSAFALGRPRGRRFLYESAAVVRVERVRRAAQSASRGTDHVLLSLRARRRFLAGHAFIAGSDRLIAA